MLTNTNASKFKAYKSVIISSDLYRGLLWLVRKSRGSRVNAYKFLKREWESRMYKLLTKTVLLVRTYFWVVKKHYVIIVKIMNLSQLTWLNFFVYKVNELFHICRADVSYQFHNVPKRTDFYQPF